MRPEILRKELKKLQKNDNKKFQDIISEFTKDILGATGQSIAQEMEQFRKNIDVLFLPEITSQPNEIKMFYAMLKNRLETSSETELLEVNVRRSEKDELHVKGQSYEVLEKIFGNLDEVKLVIRRKIDSNDLIVPAAYTIAKNMCGKLFAEWKDYLNYWKSRNSLKKVDDLLSRRTWLVLQAVLADIKLSPFDLGIFIYNSSMRFQNRLIQLLNSGISRQEVLNIVYREMSADLPFIYPVNDVSTDLKEYTGYKELAHMMNKLTYDDVRRILKFPLEDIGPTPSVLQWAASFCIARYLLEVGANE